MNTIVDRQGALARGLADIRTQFGIPETFSPDVLAAAEAASTRSTEGRADWTNRPFATLDPLSSTDLDQAFAIERAAGAKARDAERRLGRLFAASCLFVLKRLLRGNRPAALAA